MTVPTTHLGETAVYKYETGLARDRIYGVIVAVDLCPSLGVGDAPTDWYYLLELPDGTTHTGIAANFGIVRHGNRFACTACKGRGEVDLDADESRDHSSSGPTRWVDCPACKGSKASQPGQTWEAP